MFLSSYELTADFNNKGKLTTMQEGKYQTLSQIVYWLLV